MWTLDESDQRVRESLQAPGRLGGAHARSGPLRRRALRRRRTRRTRRPEHGRLALAPEIGPGHDPLHLDHDRHPDGVVLAQPPVPEESALLGRPREPLGRGADAVQEIATGRPIRRCFPLDEHVLRAGRKAVLTSVVRKGDVRVPLDPLELLAEAERGGEGNRPGLAITQSDRRNWGDDCSACRRYVCERGGQITG
jgi:hypothetical protein